MKKIYLFLFVMALVSSCKTDKKETLTVSTDLGYASFGEKIDATNTLSAKDMSQRFNSLTSGDTLQTKVSAVINEVCSKKGCWMKLDLGNDEEVMVRFKDYGFFMPLDAEGEVIVRGKAYVTEVSVDDLRHYAEDAGKSKEEIDAIVTPELAYAFEADGVLLKE